MKALYAAQGAVRTHPDVANQIAPRTAPGAGRAWERSIVGGFYLAMGGIHLGLVAARPEVYRHFADHGLFGFVVTGWRDVFMAAPVFWGMCLMSGEIALGTALLLGGTPARVGWLGVLAFHLLLMLFGFGFWLWSVPAIAVLVWLALRDERRRTGPPSDQASP
jgi:hypothetical protein